jgi:hypothetical protein
MAPPEAKGTAVNPALLACLALQGFQGFKGKMAEPGLEVLDGKERTAKMGVKEGLGPLGSPGTRPGVCLA